MMVAVGLTVLMMTMVVTVFGLVMDSIRGSRASIEVTDRLRATRNRLQRDLEGITAPLTPPLDPAKGLGYFELVEGPMGPVYHPTEIMDYSIINDIPDATRWSGYGADSTVGDLDDVLMFTIRTDDEPFLGGFVVTRFNTSNGNFIALRTRQVQSRIAEVAWFVRGTTLYRRVLLVATPELADDERWPTLGEIATEISNNPNFQNFYQYNDLSVHLEGNPDFTGMTVDMSAIKVVPNTLGDLTKRENRYAHQPFAWPYDSRFWGNLNLPTLEECSARSPDVGALDYYTLGQSKANVQITATTDPRTTNTPKLFLPNTINGPGDVFQLLPAPPGNYPLQRLMLTSDSPPYPVQHMDAWRHPHPAKEQNHVTGQFVNNGIRVGVDVILTNVLSYDVKVWDPGAPIFTLNDTSDSTYVTLDSLYTDDPPVVHLDTMGNTVSEAAVAYGVERVRRAIANNTWNDKILGFGAYVDLNYMCRAGLIGSANAYPPANFASDEVVNGDSNPPMPQFHHNGDPRSGLMGTGPTNTGPRQIDPPPTPPNDVPQIRSEELIPSVYDTYSTHYESDGMNQFDCPWMAAAPAGVKSPAVDVGINGIDDNNNGSVDEKTAWPYVYTGENETAPPYAHPLRGIQIKIRVFEPDTRLVREVTLEHEFLPQ